MGAGFKKIVCVSCKGFKHPYCDLHVPLCAESKSKRHLGHHVAFQRVVRGRSYRSRNVLFTECWEGVRVIVQVRQEHSKRGADGVSGTMCAYRQAGRNTTCCSVWSLIAVGNCPALPHSKRAGDGTACQLNVKRIDVETLPPPPALHTHTRTAPSLPQKLRARKHTHALRNNDNGNYVDHNHNHDHDHDHHSGL